ncbi:MAG: phosphoenolpyruvate--protein phosphotransferase [Deltaproteobacteria bacterium CG1_02_45_11]|nr:MAG: phosphoenolpyruvate--protein phosphotransferase [Deltaproteobacteria bacterium CG1_02_45_11]
MSETDAKEIILKGVSGSPGICIGKAYLVDSEGIDVVDRYYIKKNQIQSEENRFKAAVMKARKELNAIIEDRSEDTRRNIDILETHMILLKDKLLYGKTLETVKKERINAEWAFKKVVANVKSMFKNMSDPYLKERAADIVHVSDHIMRHLVGAKSKNIADIDQRVILVAHDLSPAETSQIQLERIMGFITDLGGSASHTSIIARTLDIPAVLGLDKATELIDNGDIVVVDGSAGLVIIHPLEQTLVQFEERKNRYEEYQAAITRKSHLPAVTADGFRLQIMGNIELPEEVVSVLDHGGDGIGLYRTEYQYLNRFNFPDEFELFDKYKEVVEVMAPLPVTIRTLDINGDIAVAYASDIDEPNPALGMRAIRYCLQRPDIFKTQLRAILRASAFGNVRILFPMISTYDEILEAKNILNEVADSLDRKGTVFNKDIEIGIMIEVPSAVFMADVMAEAVDFFSIGTNDLIQYAFAMDRGNRQVAYLYNPLHPAVIRMVKHVADVAKDKGIKIYMCGEMAGDPMNLPILLGLGIDELSMNPVSIPIVKSLLRSLSVEDTKLFVKDVLNRKTTAEVIELVQNTFGSIISDKIYTE